MIKRVLFAMGCVFSFTVHANLEVGYVAGTLVKTPAGYAEIETLRPGDFVLLCHASGGCIYREVIYTNRYKVQGYWEIQVGGISIGFGQDQKLYSPDQNDWIYGGRLSLFEKLQNVRNQDLSIANKKRVEVQVTLYSLIVQGNMFHITPKDILVGGDCVAVYAHW